MALEINTSPDYGDKDPKKDLDLEKIGEMIGKLPELNYDKYYQELSATGIYLDDDPTAVGLNSLNMKIAQIDSQKTRIGYVLTLAIQHENDIESTCKFINRVYDKKRASFLGSVSIKELGNQNLREAAVEREFAILLDVKNDMEISLMKAKSFTKTVQQVFNALDSTNKNISRQLTAIQTMVEIGEISRTTTTFKNE